MSTTATRTATATHQPGSSGSAVRLPSPRVHSAHVPAPTSRQPARGRIQLSEVPFASAMNDRDLALLGACWTSRRRLMLVNLGRLGAPSDAVALRPVQESDASRVTGGEGNGSKACATRCSRISPRPRLHSADRKPDHQATRPSKRGPRGLLKRMFRAFLPLARTSENTSLTNALSFEQCPDRDGLPPRQHPHRRPSPMSTPKPTGGPYLHFSYETSRRMPGEV